MINIWFFLNNTQFSFTWMRTLWPFTYRRLRRRTAHILFWISPISGILTLHLFSLSLWLIITFIKNLCHLFGKLGFWVHSWLVLPIVLWPRWISKKHLVIAADLCVTCFDSGRSEYAFSDLVFVDLLGLLIIYERHYVAWLNMHIGIRHMLVCIHPITIQCFQ